MSEEAASWAEKIKVGNARAKSVLMRLGAFADSEGVAWAAVPTLADRLECDDRTIQRALRFLEKHGFLKNTGRFRYKCVPYYQLDLSGEARAALLLANGDILSPLDAPVGATDVTVKGDSSVTQNKRNSSSEGSDEPSSERAGGRETDVCEVAFEAYPVEGRRGPSSLKLWRSAWASEVAGGASGLVLLGAVRAYAGDRRAWGSSGRPKAAHAWLEGGCWDGFVVEASAPVNALGPAAWPGPAEVRQLVVAAQGEAFAKSWLDPARWDGAAVVTKTRIAAERLRAVLKGSDVVVLDPAKAGEAVG